MERVRWGLVLAICVGVSVVSGCQWKVIKRAEWERLQQAVRLNAGQADRITGLIHEKELLDKQLSQATSERDALQAQLESQGEIAGLLRQELEDLRKKVGDLVGFHASPEGPVLELQGDVMFDRGKATLTSQGKTVLAKVAEVIKDKPNEIRVSGYTDSDPIKYSGWDSNFHLSGARALSVLNQLKAQGVDPARMHFAGYGEHKLFHDENGKEDKKRSRRAEILLMYIKAAPAAEAE